MHFAKEPKQRKGNMVGRFLNSLALGLMTRLTDVITDAASSSVSEQRRCLRAIEEMITVSKEYSQIARPQVSAMAVALTQ